MRTHLYTIHRKGEQGLRVTGDRFSWLALLFLPGWLIWQRLWVTTFVLLALLVAFALLVPVAVAPALFGIAVVCAFEGPSIIRNELSLRGWREAGTVEARSEAGAEELYLTGSAA